MVICSMPQTPRPELRVNAGFLGLYAQFSSPDKGEQRWDIPYLVPVGLLGL